MMVLGAIVRVFELVVVLAAAPMLVSVIAKTKARFGGRVGPPWLQPYSELYKLMLKTPVYSKSTTWVFRAGPLVGLATLLTAATIIPVLSERPLFGFSGDVILVAYLLALGRLFTVLAAMDAASSFEAMGASREASFGAMSEPALFLSFVALAVATQSTELGTMLGSGLLLNWSATGPGIVLVGGTLLIVLLVETCRVPVDDPATHLELTMIHEVMVLDHSGVELAYITYGAALKLLLFASILVHVAFPHPPSLHVIGPLLRIIEVGAVAVLIGMIESSTARIRLNRVPLLLAGATVLSALAVVLVLGGRA